MSSEMISKSLTCVTYTTWDNLSTESCVQAWTSARHLCVNQMEQELEKEKRLSLHFRRKVKINWVMSYSCSILQSLTLLLSLPEGHPGGSSNVSLSLPPNSRAGCTNLPPPPVQQAAQLFFWLSHQPAFQTSTDCKASAHLWFHSCWRLPWTSCWMQQSHLLRSGPLRLRVPSRAQTPVWPLPWETGLNLPALTLANSWLAQRLLVLSEYISHWSSSPAGLYVMVIAIYKRFVDRSKTVHLTDFDESFITAREAVVCAIQDMDDGAQSAAFKWALQQLEKSPEVITSPAKRGMTLLKHLCYYICMLWPCGR